MDMESQYFSFDMYATGYLEDDIAEWSNLCETQETVDEQNLDGQEVNHYLDNTSMENFLVADVFNTFNNDESSISPAESSCIGIKQEQSHDPSSNTIQRCMETINPSHKREDSYGVAKMAYPFDMVKRGGIEGHATLKDINLFLLMPPTKPIKHPVGEFTDTSGVSATTGFGMSGKAVVALTKIHTQGRGTITVIRTAS